MAGEKKSSVQPFIFRVRDGYYIRAAYPAPAEHRHFAAHLMFALEPPLTALVAGQRITAAGLAIGSAVPHTLLSREPALVVFIDELTPLCCCMKHHLLQGAAWRTLDETAVKTVTAQWQQVRTPEQAEEAAAATCRTLGLEAAHPPAVDARVLAAADYMKKAANLETVTIQEVAGAVHLSPSRLTHLFRQETGISPHLYLSNLKLERAFYLLEDGRSLTNVCMAAGFATPSHMADTSRELYGMPMTTVKQIFLTGLGRDRTADGQK